MRLTYTLVTSVAVLLGNGLIHAALGFQPPVESRAPSAKAVKIPMKPLPADDVKTCGLSLVYPLLKNEFSSAFDAECVGSYRADEGAGVVLGYVAGAISSQSVKSIDINITPTGIAQFVKPSEKRHSSVLQNTNGKLQSLIRTGPNERCENYLRTIIKPISASNWHGWTVEDLYDKGMGGKSTCQSESSKYRCISFVIGNAKMSAEFGGACFPTSQESSGNQEMTYDLFLKMVKSIRFSEP